MAITTALVADLVAPPVSRGDRIVFIKGLYGTTNKHQLEDSGIVLLEDGTVTSPVHFNKIIDKVTYTDANVVHSAVDTFIDLNLGHDIVLYLNGSTRLHFNHRVVKLASVVDVINITIIRNTTSTEGCVITLAQDTHYEGGAPYSSTGVFGSVSYMCIIAAHLYASGSLSSLLLCRRPTASLVPPESRTGASSASCYSGVFLEEQPQTPGQDKAISTQAGETYEGRVVVSRTASDVIISDVVINPTTDPDPAARVFTSTVIFEGCWVNRLLPSLYKLPNNSESIVLDLSQATAFYLSHTLDITSFSLTNVDQENYCSVILIRQKDTSASPRTIYFDPAVFHNAEDLILTQTPGAVDIIVIQVVGGEYIASVLTF